MKARTNPPERLIAAYGLEEAKLRELSLFCDRESIRLRAVLPQEADCTVMQLISGTLPAESICREPPQAECLIFAGFDRPALSETVDALRAAGLRVALKAIATPSNIGWKLSDLLAELAREHEYMAARGGNK